MVAGDVETGVIEEGSVCEEGGGKVGCVKGDEGGVCWGRLIIRENRREGIGTEGIP